MYLIYSEYVQSGKTWEGHNTVVLNQSKFA